MKVKIVLISEALGGGVRKHVIDILENIDKDKFDIYFMYNFHRADSIMNEKIPDLINRGINLIKIENMYNKIGIYDFVALKNIYRNLKIIKPDIVHCHSSKAGALGRIAARLAKVKFIYYTPHAYVFQNSKLSVIKKSIYIHIEKLLSRCFTTKTINVSNGEKNYALNYNIDKEEKLKVIYNGVDCNFTSTSKNNYIKDKLRKEFDISNKDLVIGVISRVDEQKDPKTFVNIAKVIVKKYANTKFLYIGDGDLYESIKSKIIDEKLEKSIIFPGFRKDTNDILSIFDIVLTTSFYEGMPYVLIESLSSGLPIVATNTIGNNEVAIDGENGLLFEVENVNEGIKKVSILVEDIGMRQKLGKNSLEKYNSTFTLKMMINSYENLYLNHN